MTSDQGTSSHRGLSGGELVEHAEACGLTPMLYGRPATESGSNIRGVPRSIENTLPSSASLY